ncbi:MAG: rhodanese-like domain-containing protein [Fibromonadaceae bacterium]|jgi:rhodanese-related sulfurtransferase|nr:rhodanese-like domain-containing protein [Fibromonadaceae bacterium]
MKKLSFVTFLILICFLCFCNAEEAKKVSAGDAPKAMYKKISAEEAKTIMSESSEYILLDVRTAEEFKERHIEGAILIPRTEIKKRAAIELPNKDALILVYCRSGRRSSAAAQELASMGYVNVQDFGGINDWR